MEANVVEVFLGLSTACKGEMVVGAERREVALAEDNTEAKDSLAVPLPPSPDSDNLKPKTPAMIGH